jgi:hypothetical protein
MEDILTNKEWKTKFSLLISVKLFFNSYTKFLAFLMEDILTNKEWKTKFSLLISVKLCFNSYTKF